MARQMLTDEALERVEEIASCASGDALQLLESLPQDPAAGPTSTIRLPAACQLPARVG
ncbi:MAG TPA: hypothetical protein VGP18_08435 [Solirubrobacteraceae bacterium]|nr:hypothetical protein [Solirubrobacteraceae bacterium]